MGKVSTYLNFNGNTEEAFNFYKSVFGTEFIGDIFRMGQMPGEDVPEMNDKTKNLVMNVMLPILGGHILMGTDVVEAMGQVYRPGNNVSISLHPDTREDADKYFELLRTGGSVGMPMADQFWGDYYGDCTDKFGIQWMVNYNKEYLSV